MEQGKLYLCATPIGNLEDITFRVVRTLKEVDLIAAEDTRNSIKLLNHFEIRTPLTSYHEYNRIEKAHVLIESARGGRPRVTVEKPLIVYERPGVYTAEILDVYGY